MSGRRIHGHGHLVERGNHLAPVPQPQLVVEALDSFVFELEPVLPFKARVVVGDWAAGDRGMAANPVVDLPGDQLLVFAQGLGHGLNDALGIVPVNVVVETNGAARAFATPNALLIKRKNLRMLLGQPDRRRGGGGGEHHLDPCLAHDIHDALQPIEFEFAILGFAEAPGEIADADHVNAGFDHEVGILIPLSFWLFGCSSVRKDPLFRIIIDAKIHMVVARGALCGTLGTSAGDRNGKVEA